MTLFDNANDGGSFEAYVTSRLSTVSKDFDASSFIFRDERESVRR